MKILKVFALLVGLCLLIWIIHKIGLEQLKQGFQMLGWKIVIPILILFPCYLLFTASWQLFLKRFGHHSISFWRLFQIKVGGEAANTLTPLNFAGGDPLRVWLLSKDFPVAISGASVVVDRTLQILAIVSIIFLGNVAAIFKLSLPSYANKLLGITAGFLLLFILLFVFHQSRGLFEKLIKLVSKLKIRKFSENTIKKITEMDQHIGSFYRQDRRLFVVGFLFYFVARIIGIFEIYFLAHFLDVPMNIWGAIFFAAVIPVTNLLGGIVPGTLGVLEGVMSSLFYALHWNPAAGIVIQIARRIRALFWILLGMVFILMMKGRRVKAN